MNKIDAIFKNAVFTYYMTNNKGSNVSEFDKKISFLDWNIYISNKTNLQYAITDYISVVIIGYCIDGDGIIEPRNLSDYIAKKIKTLDMFISFSKRLAGKYIIFLNINGTYYVFTDATASLPVYYTNSKKIQHISSHEYLVAKYAKCNLSKNSLYMLKGSDQAKTLPNNITFHENVYLLLPNHYYEIKNNCSIRITKKDIKNTISPQIAAQKSLEIINHIKNQIINDFEIKCPLTGGYDSRVVFAVLLGKKFESYTMTHKMSLTDSDLAVPRQITKKYKIKHFLIEDKIPTAEQFDIANKIFGKGMYSEYTLQLIATLIKDAGNSCILNGDILGQIGKSSLHKNIPPIFMGYRYYACKVHNTSLQALKQSKKWYQEISKEFDKKYICDLFSEEIRLGRWAGNENCLFSTFGINVLNIFNCQKIIEIWECVDRKDRKNAQIHKELLKIINSELLNYSFNHSESPLLKIANSNFFLFYIATFTKHYLQALKHFFRSYG